MRLLSKGDVAVGGEFVGPHWEQEPSGESIGQAAGGIEAATAQCTLR